jgi:hypothetical protein
MGSVRPGVPRVLARSICDALGLKAAVETGTYQGDSLLELAGIVPEAWSIELSGELHDAAKKRLAQYPNLHCAGGDSTAVLPGLLATVPGPALFWLDGHWSGGETAGADRECPVLAEISMIDAWAFAADSSILVDDARLFFGPPPPPHDRTQWPTFEQVFDRLRATHRRYITVLEDVVIAVPTRCRGVVEDYWLAVLAGEVSEG